MSMECEAKWRREIEINEEMKIEMKQNKSFTSLAEIELISNGNKEINCATKMSKRNRHNGKSYTYAVFFSKGEPTKRIENVNENRED